MSRRTARRNRNPDQIDLFPGAQETEWLRVSTLSPAELREWKRQQRRTIVVNANIPLAVKRLLLFLDSLCIEKSFCWPSRQRIAEALAFSGERAKKSVQRLVRQAVADGYLITEQGMRPNGSRTSNRYRIRYAALQRTYLPHRAPASGAKRHPPPVPYGTPYE